jgi:hypothetical protein
MIRQLIQKVKNWWNRGKFTSNENAAAIIRRFIQGGDDPYEWDDFETIEEKNPDVALALELCWFFANWFPSRHSTEYCNPKAFPYFLKIADALEKNGFSDLNHNGIKESLRRKTFPENMYRVLDIHEISEIKDR